VKHHFIHIPKNGGTAIRATYGDGNMPSTHPHNPVEYFPDADLLWCTFRNPLDRAVSICAHLFRYTHQPITADLFRGWVADGFPHQPKAGIEDGLSGVVPGFLITDPQKKWFKAGVDMRVVLYERMNHDLPALLEKIGVEPRPMAKHNVGRNRERDYSIYYDETTMKRVTVKYQDDWNLWYKLWTAAEKAQGLPGGDYTFKGLIK